MVMTAQGSLGEGCINQKVLSAPLRPILLPPKGCESSQDRLRSSSQRIVKRVVMQRVMLFNPMRQVRWVSRVKYGRCEDQPPAP